MDSVLKNNENYYPQEFLKCKCIRKIVIRHINDNLSGFSYSDESDEEQIKDIRSMIFERTSLKIYFFEGAILKESNEE